MKTEKEKVITADLRDTLKDVMKKEIENLSATLEALEPEKKLDFIIKLMPFVFPKVDTVKASHGEPWKSDW